MDVDLFLFDSGDGNALRNFFSVLAEFLLMVQIPCAVSMGAVPMKLKSPLKKDDSALQFGARSLAYNIIIISLSAARRRGMWFHSKQVAPKISWSISRFPLAAKIN